MRNRVMAGLLALGLTSAACGGASTDTTGATTSVDASTTTTTVPPTTAPADDEVGTLASTTTTAVPPTTVPADDEGGTLAAIDVEPSLESDRSSTASIGPDGGDVEATAADGTTYTLTLPAGALLAETEITMTPVDGLLGVEGALEEGVEADIPALGVLLEPEGLIFLEPGRVTIRPPVPDESLIGFATFAGGSDFHLQPLDVGGDEIGIEVEHFSVWGAVAETNVQQIYGRARRAGLNTGYRMSGRATYVTVLNVLKLTGVTDASVYELNLHNWAENIVDDASSDGLELVIASALSWQLNVKDDGAYLAENAGVDPDEWEARFAGDRSSIGGAIARLLRSAVESEIRACKSEKDPHRGIRALRWVILDIPLEARGLHVRGVEGYSRAWANEQLAECLRFELKFDSTATRTPSSSRVGTAFQLGGLDLGDDSFDVSLIGSGSLVFKSLDLTDVPAQCRQEGFPGALVGEVKMTFNLTYESQWITGVTLHLSLEPPSEMIVCDQAGTVVSINMWSGIFLARHAARLQNDGFLMQLAGQGEVFAQFNSSTQGESTTIQLIHDPLP